MDDLMAGLFEHGAGEQRADRIVLGEQHDESLLRLGRHGETAQIGDRLVDRLVVLGRQLPEQGCAAHRLDQIAGHREAQERPQLPALLGMEQQPNLLAGRRCLALRAFQAVRIAE